MKNEIQEQIDRTEVKIEQAEAKLAAFLEEFKVLRAKYPEIEFVGGFNENAIAMIRVGQFNVREVELE
jgi:hypothetical protein